MKVLLSLLLLFAGWPAVAIEPNSKALRVCPNGHTTLKDIPIIYGTPPSNGRDLAKWTKAVENFKFAPGGCTSISSSPKIRVTCMKCRFAHEMALTDMPESGTWSRTSSNRNSFRPQLSEAIRSFPCPPLKQQHWATSYTQGLSDEFQPKHEFLNYLSKESAAQVRAKIDGWLRESGITTAFEILPIPGKLAKVAGEWRTWESYKWEGDSFSITVDDRRERYFTGVNVFFFYKE